jgi:hypothetical protein
LASGRPESSDDLRARRPVWRGVPAVACMVVPAFAVDVPCGAAGGDAVKSPKMRIDA